MKVILLIACLGFPTAALAHDRWGNGEPVPAWVKAACCGPEDVHHIPADHMHTMPDGYHVDGLGTVIPYSQALPSPDGETWGFWNPTTLPKANVYCFFTGLQGS